MFCIYFWWFTDHSSFLYSTLASKNVLWVQNRNKNNTFQVNRRPKQEKCTLQFKNSVCSWDSEEYGPACPIFVWTICMDVLNHRWLGGTWAGSMLRPILDSDWTWWEIQWPCAFAFLSACNTWLVVISSTPRSRPGQSL